jgi:hypothetical protein
MMTPDSGTSFITFPSWAYNEFKTFTDFNIHDHEAPCTWEEYLDIAELTLVVDGIDYSIPSHHWFERVPGGNRFSRVAILA